MYCSCFHPAWLVFTDIGIVESSVVIFSGIMELSIIFTSA